MSFPHETKKIYLNYINYLYFNFHNFKYTYKATSTSTHSQTEMFLYTFTVITVYFFTKKKYIYKYLSFIVLLNIGMNYSLTHLYKQSLHLINIELVANFIIPSNMCTRC